MLSEKEKINEFYKKFGNHNNVCPYYTSINQVIEILKSSNYVLSKIYMSGKSWICKK